MQWKASKRKKPCLLRTRAQPTTALVETCPKTPPPPPPTVHVRKKGESSRRRWLILYLFDKCNGTFVGPLSALRVTESLNVQNKRDKGDWKGGKSGHWSWANGRRRETLGTPVVMDRRGRMRWRRYSGVMGGFLRAGNQRALQSCQLLTSSQKTKCLHCLNSNRALPQIFTRGHVRLEGRVQLPRTLSVVSIRLHGQTAPLWAVSRPRLGPNEDRLGALN